MNAKSSKELKIENATLQVRVMELDHKLQKQASDTAVIVEAFRRYAARKQKVSKAKALDVVNAEIAKTVANLNKELKEKERNDND